MSDLVKCPHCSKDIENDSFYCDQCGAELMYCPQCHIFGKGKFCSKCRTPLVPASKSASSPATSQPVSPQTSGGVQMNQPVNPQPASGMQPNYGTAQNQQPPVAQGGSAGQQAANAAAQPGMQSTMKNEVAPTRLVCRAAGIVLVLKDGAIIGRRNGDYVAQFSNQPYVSGTHARIGYVMQSWTISDLGSTNGTMVNGNALVAGAPCPISVGDTVRIATLDFIVE